MLDFFTSNFDTHDSRVVRRLILLNSLLIMGCVTLIFFMFFNYFVVHNVEVSLLNLIASIIALAIFYDLRKNRQLERASYLTIACFYLFLILFVHFNQNSSFGLIWTQAFPLLVVGLIGFRRGLIINALYFMMIFYLAFDGIGVWNGGQWDLISFFRLVFASLLMLFIVSVFDVALEKSYEMLERQSVTDPLTQLYNRRKIMDIIKREIERARRYKKPLSLILFDVDDFKQINDRLGHQKGDMVLKKISEQIKNTLRSSDFIGRWGGEEFMIVCPETTLDEAETVAEKLRSLVENIQCEAKVQITCSFGVTGFESITDTTDLFIHRADMAMYRAKESGKNRVSR